MVSHDSLLIAIAVGIAAVVAFSAVRFYYQSIIRRQRRKLRQAKRIEEDLTEKLDTDRETFEKALAVHKSTARDLEAVRAKLEEVYEELHGARQKLTQRALSPSIHQSVYDALEGVRHAARKFDERVLQQNVDGAKGAATATDAELRDLLANVSQKLTSAIRELEGNAPA